MRSGEEAAIRRNHGSGILDQESGRMNHGRSDAKEIIKKGSWRRNHGGGIVQHESWRMNLGGVVIVALSAQGGCQSRFLRCFVEELVCFRVNLRRAAAETRLHLKIGNYRSRSKSHGEADTGSDWENDAHLWQQTKRVVPNLTVRF